MPTIAHPDRWYCFDGLAVTGQEARLLEEFVAEASERARYDLGDVYRVLQAARRVLARAGTDPAASAGPGAAVPAGGNRPAPCGPTPAQSADP